MTGDEQASSFPDQLQSLKLLLLGDAVEGWVGIWEPLWSIRGELPDVPPEAHIPLAEHLLVDLLDGGLADFLGRTLVGTWPSVELGDILQPLSDVQARAAISSTWWRMTPLGRPPGDFSIGFCASEAGRLWFNSQWSGEKP